MSFNVMDMKLVALLLSIILVTFFSFGLLIFFSALGPRIDPIWWKHCAIFHSSQCSMTGVAMAVICYAVCAMLHVTAPVLLIGKSSPLNGSSYISPSLTLVYNNMPITIQP